MEKGRSSKMNGCWVSEARGGGGRLERERLIGRMREAEGGGGRLVSAPLCAVGGEKKRIRRRNGGKAENI